MGKMYKNNTIHNQGQYVAIFSAFLQNELVM
jgi:hypothetical protein